MANIIQIIYVDRWFHVSCAFPMQPQASNYHFDRKLTVTSSRLGSRKNGESDNIYVKTKSEYVIFIPQL